MRSATTGCFRKVNFATTHPLAPTTVHQNLPPNPFSLSPCGRRQCSATMTTVADGVTALEARRAELVDLLRCPRCTARPSRHDVGDCVWLEGGLSTRMAEEDYRRLQPPHRASATAPREETVSSDVRERRCSRAFRVGTRHRGPRRHCNRGPRIHSPGIGSTDERPCSSATNDSRNTQLRQLHHLVSRHARNTQDHTEECPVV